MKKRNKRKSKFRNIGAIPGSLRKIEGEDLSQLNADLIDFTADNFLEKPVDNFAELKECLQDSSISWVNITGVNDPDKLSQIGTVYGVDDLVLEDIMNLDHRPKIEEFPDYSFIVVKMLSPDTESDGVLKEQVSLVLGKNFVLSFQEREGDVFDPIRDRIRKGQGRVRSSSADYLCYLLIDVIIDNYFRIVDTMGERLDDLENRVFTDPDEKQLTELQSFKQELVDVRRVVLPLRETLAYILRGDSQFVNENNIKYYRDAYDHTMEVFDALESYIEMTNSIRDLYLSSLSNKMNQIMKVLTIMASLFIPLTFIVGIYGMNFTNMPEIYDWDFGYISVWIIMILVTIGMIIFFKRKKWF